MNWTIDLDDELDTLEDEIAYLEAGDDCEGLEREIAQVKAKLETIKAANN